MTYGTAEDLRLLWLVQRHGTLSAAADELGLTPSAVTQRVARIERKSGLPLVDRGPWGARLTVAGARLAAHGADIDAQVTAGQAELARLQGSRALRIGAFHAAALHLVPPALTALRHQVDGVEPSLFEIASHDAVPLVAAGALDIAVMATWDDPPPADARVVTTEVTTDPMVLVVPDDHPLASRADEPVALAELADSAWVVIQTGAARAQFDRATQRAGFDPVVRFETQSYDIAQALVATGYAVALVSRLALRDDPSLAQVALAEVALAKAGLHRTIHCVSPRRPLNPTVSAQFAALLRAVAVQEG